MPRLGMCSNNLKYLQNKTLRVFTTFEDFKMSRTFLFLHFTFLIRASNVVKTWCLTLQVVQVKKTNSTLRHEEWKQAKNYLLRKVTCNKLEDVSHDIFKDIDLRKTMLALWPRVATAVKSRCKYMRFQSLFFYASHHMDGFMTIISNNNSDNNTKKNKRITGFCFLFVKTKVSKIITI